MKTVATALRILAPRPITLFWIPAGQTHQDQASGRCRVPGLWGWSRATFLCMPMKHDEANGFCHSKVLTLVGVRGPSLALSHFWAKYLNQRRVDTWSSQVRPPTALWKLSRCLTLMASGDVKLEKYQVMRTMFDLLQRLAQAPTPWMVLCLPERVNFIDCFCEDCTLRNVTSWHL